MKTMIYVCVTGTWGHHQPASFDQKIIARLVSRLEFLQVYPCQYKAKLQYYPLVNVHITMENHNF